MVAICASAVESVQPGLDGLSGVVPALLALTRDGDRLVGLTAVDPCGAADTAAFAALLQLAFDRRADALD